MQPRSILALFLAMIFLLAGTCLFASADFEFAAVQNGFTTGGDQVAAYAPDHVLVKFRKDALAASRLDMPFAKGAALAGTATGLKSFDALTATAGVTRIERPFIAPQNLDKAADLGTDRWFMLRVAPGDMEALAKALEADDAVETAQPEYYAFPAAIPNDPLYPDHWGHNNTAQMISYDWATYSHTGPTVGTVGFDANAETAWNTTYGDPSVIIAIIDSGVDIYHPDLHTVAGYDFGDNDTNPMDDSRQPGHGTCCAGVAAATANNNTGIVGIGAGCSLMPLKVADRRGSMSFTSITNAIYYAADNGVDVISMSLGAAISSDAATDAAIAYAHNAGVTILAATGNENNSVISYPAINEYVIGVGAASPCGDRKRSSSLDTELNPGVFADPNGYTCDGERWWGSNYGSATKDDRGAVDVIAPTILPTTDISGSGGYDPGDYDMFFNGTSCATPYAAGVCGLIKSAFPAYTPDQVRAQLTGTAIDIVNVESGSGWDRYSGYGMVDAAAAISGGSVTTPPVAAFTGTPTSGDYPLDVQFTDQSSNSPTSWSWAFGDGGTATVQNPLHTYAAAGSYSVSLTVTNADGSDSLTKTGYITVTEPGSGGAAMHVAGITVSRVLSGRKYYGRAVITMEDDQGAPVSGATVTALYTGDITGTISGLTGTDGVVTLTTPKKSYATVEYCFEVTGATHSTLAYDPSANVMTKACESGSVFSADTGRLVTGLVGNSPNPFNPRTVISFSLVAESHARLAIYDVRGQLVQELASGTFGPGEHSFIWTAGDSPSGVYFYRLETKSMTDTRKMILLK